MAAHGLTIVRQCRKVICEGKPTSQVTGYVKQALSAPGTCFTVGFNMTAYTNLTLANDRVIRGEGTPEDTIVPVLDAAIASHMWMDAYPSMEAISAAMALYIRVGTPYWKTRSRKFDAGDRAVHARVRSDIAARFPLDRRAPAIL